MSAIKDFIFAIGMAFVGLMLVALLVTGLNKSSSTVEKSYEKMDDFNVMLEESDYTKFDGAVISGDSVIAAIKGFESSSQPICVEIAHTGVCYVYTDETLQTKSTAKISNASRKGTAEYINPTAYYLGSIERDSTDNSIRKIVFEIQK